MSPFHSSSAGLASQTFVPQFSSSPCCPSFLADLHISYLILGSRVPSLYPNRSYVPRPLSWLCDPLLFPRHPPPRQCSSREETCVLSEYLPRQGHVALQDSVPIPRTP